MDQVVHPMTAKPERAAVYRIKNPRGVSDVFSKWDGEYWHIAHTKYEAAAMERRRSICSYDGWFTGWHEVPAEMVPVGF